MSLPLKAASTKVWTVAGLFIIAAGLHLGQALFVPLALAVLLSLVLDPLVYVGERLRLPRALSVVAVVALVFGLLGLAGILVAGEAASLAKKLPEYRTNVLAKLDVLRVPLAKSMNQFREAVKDVEAGASTPPPGKVALHDPAGAPIRVEVVENPLSPFRLVGALGGSLLSGVGSFAIVLLLVILFLIFKAEIRDRVVRLAGDTQVQRTTQTITEATRGVSRFLISQAFVNSSFGVAFGLMLHVMGVPGAILWGFLAAVARFIPYAGPITAGLLPVLLSIGVFPGWDRPLMVAACVIIMEVGLNWIVEPMVYGRRSGISPLAVVLAAVFWAWMWGTIGLVLAIPLTVTLVSFGKYLPSLRFLTVALGNEPALDAKVQVYHRLLGRLQAEASELLEKELAGGESLAELYDRTVLPVLRMADTDSKSGKLSRANAASLTAALREIVDDLEKSARSALGLRNPAGVRTDKARILCLPAGSGSDELSAHMLAQVLNLQGFQARALGVEKMAGEILDLVASEGPDLLVICTSHPSNLIRSRYLYKRLRRRFGDIAVLEGVWGAGDAFAMDGRIPADGKALVVSSFVEAEIAVAEGSKEAALRRPSTASAR